MIPKNITRDAVLAALREIDSVGVPKERNSRIYSLVYDSKLYPPILVLSCANRIANGTLLEPSDFGGGCETNTFLTNLGFSIISQCDSTLFSCPPIDIVTATLHCKQANSPNETSRLKLVERIIQEFSNCDILLFPAGLFCYGKLKQATISEIAKKVQEIICKNDSSMTVCFGVDCDFNKDQLAVAVDSSGILALGRKFYTAKGEENIQIASSCNELEQGYKRAFEKKGKRFWLAICYDCFGIRKQNIPNPGVDILLTLVHKFRGQNVKGSGYVDFARKGFAGASAHWSCPVFGTAVFFEREIPERWPTGVSWNSHGKSVKTFKYEDNTLHWHQRKQIDSTPESAVCMLYSIS